MIDRLNLIASSDYIISLILELNRIQWLARCWKRWRLRDNIPLIGSVATLNLCPHIRLILILRQQFKDVVIDNHFIDPNGFSAKRTDGFISHRIHAFLADGMVHTTYDNWFPLVPIILPEANIALVNVLLELLLNIFFHNNINNSSNI